MLRSIHRKFVKARHAQHPSPDLCRLNSTRLILYVANHAWVCFRALFVLEPESPHVRVALAQERIERRGIERIQHRRAPHDAGSTIAFMVQSPVRREEIVVAGLSGQLQCPVSYAPVGGENCSTDWAIMSACDLLCEVFEHYVCV